MSASVSSGRDAGHHAVPLVLAVGGVADFLREREMRVLERAHHGRVHTHVQRLPPVGIARGIEHPVERLGVANILPRSGPTTARYASAMEAIARGE